MAPLIQTLQSNEILRSAARFALIGILGTLIDFSLFGVFHLGLGISALPANTLSYSAGIINNYFFHRRWTFASHLQQKSAGKQFTQFAGVSLSAMLLNNLIVLLLTPELSKILADTAVSSLIAKLCAVWIGLSWNFFANRIWTFRIVRQ
ncbi:MAG: GtrA family protein [Anaerolineaceae bacterium]|nr:GtrA family protein [Anaerolineaceae bacterium]